MNKQGGEKIKLSPFKMMELRKLGVVVLNNETMDYVDKKGKTVFTALNYWNMNRHYLTMPKQNKTKALSEEWEEGTNTNCIQYIPSSG